MLVSVIIPTYKPGHYIYECLDSLYRQDVDSSIIEILIVLNGPRDPYWQELSDFISKYANMKLLFCAERGVSNARNIALKIAKGEYVIFIDDDDLVSPNLCRKLLDKGERHTLVVSKFLSFLDGNFGNFSNDYVTKAFDKTRSNSLLSRRSFLSSSCGKLIHREIIGNRLFDVQLTNSEDALFMFTISDKINQIELADSDATYYRRVRGQSASQVRIPLKQRCFEGGRLLIKFSLVYLKSPLRYNFLLYCSRIVAIIYYWLIKK